MSGLINHSLQLILRKLFHILKWALVLIILLYVIWKLFGSYIENSLIGKVEDKINENLNSGPKKKDWLPPPGILNFGSSNNCEPYSDVDLNSGEPVISRC